MNIRSITYFFSPQLPLSSQMLQQAQNFNEQAKQVFLSAGYTVQTTRAATTPFPQWAGSGNRRLPELAQQLESDLRAQGFDYAAIGPASPAQMEDYPLLPDVLAATQNLFTAGFMTGAEGVSLPAVRACAQVIHQAGTISPDGFANLRFAALANVAPGAPFFPAAYHSGGDPAFALALESADLAVIAFESAANLAEARANLIAAIQKHAQKLASAARQLAAESGVNFLGLDFSMAPFPEEARSLGAALERLGLPAVGQHGSLACAAFLADTLDRASFPRTGFNGLMLPVLEDAVLARRAGEGRLSVKDMLLYSAVCGTGLDTVPLPGETSPEELAALLLDLAALSTRLAKPLTARLMPLPGKTAGEPTSFSFDFFAPSRVLALQAAALGGLLAGDETISLAPRRR